MRAFQIKVTLNKAPQIWRRIIVPSDYSFLNLHTSIQDSMGWKDYHLYEFLVWNPILKRKEAVGVPDDNIIFDGEIVDSRKRFLKSIFISTNSTGLVSNTSDTG